MSESEAIWERINVIQDRQAAIEQRMAAHEANTKAIADLVALSRKERAEQFAVLSDKLDSVSRTVQTELAEYRGAIRFGKWIAATIIALGIPAGLLAMWGHK